MALSEDVLYIIFRMVDVDSMEKGTWSLPSQHPLVPLAYVCKQWNRIVGSLIYQNIAIVSVDGLRRLLDHLRAPGSTRELPHSPAKNLSVCYDMEHSTYSLSHENALNAYQALTDLFTTFTSLEAVDIWVRPLRSASLAALLESNCSTLKTLRLLAVRSTFDPKSLRKMTCLTRLESLYVAFGDSGGIQDDQPILTATNPVSQILLPSLVSLNLGYGDWWNGCQHLINALSCPSLEEACLRCDGPCDGPPPDVGPVFESFLRRHRTTLERVTLDTPRMDDDPFITVLQDLRHLDLRALQLDPTSLVSALPSTLLTLVTAFPEMKKPGVLQTAWWKLHSRLAESPPPNLQCVQASAVAGDCFSHHGPWEWSAIETMVDEEGKNKLKELASTFKRKGIDMLDVHCCSYSGA